MKIAVIGGGPAGLYFSILVKKWNSAVEVDLFERNAPSDTFGWGVVFSDKTLSYLQAEDIPTWEAITERFERWENVDMIHHDEKVTVLGNKFSGIARIEVLRILQERCRELGVALHFRAPVHDLAEFAHYDLIVGADGVMSEVRDEYEECFKPDLSTRTNRYIWYGTRHLFHGLTLTFRENSAGVFAAHSYKFDKTTSTFIVECDEETWAAAGFQDMDDASTRRYLEEVFHHDLEGAELLSNNSKWLNFVLVRNRHWWCAGKDEGGRMKDEGNTGSRPPSFIPHPSSFVVLLGDALATVHFSIGSGTKLALEDAIALAHALKLSDSLPDTLIEFEAKRRPVVEEYQDAAYESLLLFENLRDYMHLDPIPFAYKLMTRSGKVDLENLRRRDPEFVAKYEKCGQK
ncbi:MAG TPA: monooxygenase [Candidatus Kapabacteria bacterium]|nr:monooxygenase [Candidatus Kapabacteria bacterium]